ncbi:hypothetical protein BU24DRAFT_423249 [Aaosphaeria arxii CBS 175.79]|uniref:CENP-V/GFA domain-containing protein n=1 Tax=Aaosphaeria arxii CBS 175.79 TaxID=1450172 RepID=A0A6A5XMQ7_9PLEO|nr:uncharacterized protein BU24DRAFT_423249 [Aaosphaeria arxii CBS 175.79]KAF2014233.1 hypothetical protein BU24DRAFT_423249 [Aaosphaeria arxii CBS 175.79]
MANRNGVHHGSCACGKVTYQIKLTFPPVLDPSAESIRLYRCNCTQCQKMGRFHCKPIDMTNDFILTSSSPSEMGDYRTCTKRIGFYFCKSCGCHVVGVGGEWEEVELDVEEWAGKESKGEVKKVWRVKAIENATWVIDGKEITKRLLYVSVNAGTLDQEDEGSVDLIEWHDKGWLFYVENKDKAQGTQMRMAKPYPGGMY